MIYRVISNQDITTLAKIYVETYNRPPWNDKWTNELAIQKLDELINCNNTFGLVCIDDSDNIMGAIIGDIETYYDCKHCFIKDFFITPNMQNKGIGSKLMTEFEKELLIKGISKTYLFTSRTDITEEYYKKRGFESWNGMVMMGKDITK